MTQIVDGLIKEIKDIIILLEWSENALTTVPEDEIDNKELLLSLSDTNIPKLCSITCKPSGGADGNKVLMIAEDNLKLAMYWVQHQIRIS